MRPTFSRILTQAAKSDDRVLLLTGDHGYALFDEFRQTCPDQYINCGIAEQNMVGVAAGLAKAGFRPVVYGLSAFVPMRVLEQIKIDICYEVLPVILVGDGAGLVYGQLGVSHQCTEDLAALRVMPNLNIVSPADRFELEYCWNHLLASARPSYLRFGKADLGDVHSTLPTAPAGSVLQVRAGRADLALLATGSMVAPATKISDVFSGIPVWSAPMLEPCRTAQIQHIGSSVSKLFVLEEHSVNGGFGDLVTQALGSEAGRVTRFGTRKFSEVCGNYDYLLSYHGISRTEIEVKLKECLDL